MSRGIFLIDVFHEKGFGFLLEEGVPKCYM
jgi:hypothetical protein